MNATILLVEPDLADRDRMADWLEDAGHQVMLCGGPGEPGYDCVGIRTEHCPLAEAADVVVLDMAQAGDAMLRGTPGWQLLLLYSALGRKIVALSGSEDPVRPLPDDQVRVVRRPPARDVLLAAVDDLIEPQPSSEEVESDVDDLAD